jgi:rod shape-determining protein MreD
MRWLSCFILIYLAMALQMALAGFMIFRGFAPDLLLSPMIFLVMNSRRGESLISGLLVGLAHDLISQRPFGIYALAYAISAMLIVAIQPAVYRDHPLTHFFIALMVASFTGIFLWFNDWIYPLFHQLSQSAQPSIWTVLGSAFYTAITAPFILGLLTRIRFVFGFRAPSYGKTSSYGFAA